QPEIERLARDAPPDDVAALEGAARAVGALFAGGAMPPAITAAVREAYARLGEPPAAVRSSATAEDLPGASFAGQMETYLNVRGGRVARKAVMTGRREEGTALLPVPAALQEQPVLGPAQVEALVGLGRRAAARYGSPQDVEWVLTRGRPYLVQSRPITSLFPL